MALSATPDLQYAQRLRDLFDAVADLDPFAREDRLDAAERTDESLVREVRQLLAASCQADRVLQRLESPSGTDPCRPGALEVGQTVSHYRVLSRLGSGGMGIVYRAEDTRLRRTVALKFLPPDLTRDPEARKRLLREARAAGALDHPHLCTVYEVGETETGEVFIAMACYEGKTLQERIAEGALQVSEAVEIAAQTAEGLAAAHEAGLVHRDVKPANILVAERGGVHLLDFGLARGTDAALTRSGVTPGTIAYMSPEQAEGGAVDARADLWALGVVLYEMLAGRRPFQGDRDAAVLAAIRHGEPEPLGRLRPAVPVGLAAVVDRLLQKEPDDRSADAAEVAAELRAFQASPPRLTGRGPRVALRTVRRPLAWGAAAVIVAAVALLGVLHKPDGGAGPLDSVAVLPVANLSGDPEQEYFADGMTDLLINQLSEIGGVDRVIARSSVMRFKGSNRTPQQIGRELGVGALVEASAIREGGRVRINASLIEAETGRTLWSRSFERPMRDVLTLQRDVVREIVESLHVALSPLEGARLADAAPVDPDAFDLYVRGSQARYRMSLDGAREAVDLFSRALAEDSTFAPVYAGLAWASVFLGEEAQARQAVGKALALDPTLAEAHISLGLIGQFYDLDWMGAERAFREALRLNPGYAEAHHELGILLSRIGRGDEALREAHRALYLSPMSPRYQSGVGEVLLAGGQYGEALAASDRALALDQTYKSAHHTRVTALAMLGRHRAAREAWERCAPIGCLDGIAGTPGYVHAAAGQRSRALKELEELETTWRNAEGPGFDSAAFYAYHIAHVYSGLGEEEQALDWLERAADSEFALLDLGANPIFHHLHAEPRFQALLRRAGLPAGD